MMEVFDGIMNDDEKSDTLMVVYWYVYKAVNVTSKLSALFLSSA